ncbi:alpha/beta hydrolase family protein [Tengunoibacter tsumagoiensis]|uniref:AB hydrolase-1 domain-containing protein n=1 Tax=Tengunoibacter tsumagoiensis TaxID=2014871 RepID=A0A402A1L7_9CHLR|nr:alpha/beta fold hydrolase [Tengunoibacter tsumagoiensis]GCE12901.1 hypothetical protein KTT_27600 [Tengunoibacter tsumagoiensis]
MKHIRFLPFIALILLFISCNSSTVTTQPTPTTTSVARVTPTPTVPTVTPTPTFPTVPNQIVHFKTEDDMTLTGILYGTGKTGIICSHELHANKDIWSTNGFAQRIAAKGYMVLAYDFRGNGDSEGKGNPTKNETDLRAAVSFMRQQNVSSIVLIGSSMGGTATLKVAAHDKMTAIITLSAPQNFGSMVSDDEVRAIQAPKLFINSEDDRFSQETIHMADIASQPKDIHLYPGRLHGVALFDSEYDADVMQRIQNFLARYAPVNQ